MERYLRSKIMLKGKFAFLGTGNMAGAIIRSMQSNYSADNIVLFDKDTSKYDSYNNGYNSTKSVK